MGRAVLLWDALSEIRIVTILFFRAVRHYVAAPKKHVACTVHIPWTKYLKRHQTINVVFTGVLQSLSRESEYGAAGEWWPVCTL
jgi:hypothetical protein